MVVSSYLDRSRVPMLGLSPGVDPGFLERGFICIKVWG